MDLKKKNASLQGADVSFTRQIGDTTFIVEYQFSPTARETAYDKLKRLIMREAGLDYFSNGSRKCCSPA